MITLNVISEKIYDKLSYLLKIRQQNFNMKIIEFEKSTELNS